MSEQIPLGFALTEPEFRSRLLSAAERIAAALEALTISVTGSDPGFVEPDAAELAALTARDDNSRVEAEEMLAIIEMAHDAGRPVPLAAYRKLGIEPPDNREQDVELGAFDALQPGAGRPDDQPVTYRKGPGA